MTALTRLRALVDTLNSPQSKRHDTQSAVLYEARREAAGILAEMEWRDISTAPPDSRRVLISGRYSNGVPYVEESFRQHAGHYNARKFEPPTHWKPLPDPPVLAKTDGCRIVAHEDCLNCQCQPDERCKP